MNVTGFHGRKARTKNEMMTALRSMLIMRRSLDGIAADSIARSYGVSIPVAEQMIADERKRRAA
ncbi:hypothetical protein [Allopontixanthobacter sediminis]|uniref:Uncharacterized protein n=1 Tax=Allopontixanthobacter sediminis TaxID=1689985 RepID=A0A845AXI3_9SPHN|nr:hypothetical protein [Allopontixanthobacter sediminis]MXP42965.1 hypothetical protein [Allopontixanthobacter sediminis]